MFNIRIPITYNGDGLSVIGIFQNMKISGWYFSSDQVGYPFGQHLQDFPAIADNLLLLVSWVLVRSTNSPVLAFNLFYLSTYFFNAYGAYFGAKWAGLDRLKSVTIALLYTFLPFHFLHGPGHIYLAMFPFIPLMIGWSLREVVYSEQSNSSWSIRSLLVPIFLGCVVATSGLYFSAFVLLVLVWSFMAITSRSSIANAKRTVVAVIAIVLTTIIQFVPVILYQIKNGANLSVAKRQAFEVEFYSLRLLDLLLPIPQHRMTLFATLSERGTSVLLPGESTEFLGVLGAIGVLLLISSFFFANSRWVRFKKIEMEAQIFLLLLLFGSVGGFAQLLATFGFVQIRVWSRISIAIGFVALLAVFKFFGTSFKSFSTRDKRSVVFLSFICLISLLDTNPAFDGASYKNTSAAWQNDKDLVLNLENRFGQGARVLQVPNLKFPEQGSVNALEDYAQIRGYVHSTSLCWSYGVVFGRDTDRTSIIKTGSVAEFLEIAKKDSFDAIWVETRAFTDSGEKILVEFQSVLGAPVLQDRLGQVFVFDATPLSQLKRLNCR